MAFEGLTEKISATFKKLRGKGRLKEADVKEAMREIRMALLEADVSYKVCKDFTKSVTERCVGTEVLESLTPAQMIVKIVNEELTSNRMVRLTPGKAAATRVKTSRSRQKPPTRGLAFFFIQSHRGRLSFFFFFAKECPHAVQVLAPIGITARQSGHRMPRVTPQFIQ